jgi:hypothetical protein
MKVARHFFDCERAHKPAAVFLLERLLSNIELPVLVGFIENLKVTLVYEFALSINTPLGY